MIHHFIRKKVYFQYYLNLIRSSEDKLLNFNINHNLDVENFQVMLKHMWIKQNIFNYGLWVIKALLLLNSVRLTVCHISLHIEYSQNFVVL